MIKTFSSLIVLILSLAFAIFYVLPAYDLNQTRRNDINSLNKILDTSSEIRTLINKTKDNLNSIDPAVISRFNVFLPEKIDTIRFANDIQAIGLNDKVILSDIKVDTPANAMEKVTATPVSAATALVNTFSLGARIDQAANTNSLGTQNSPLASGANKKYATTKVAFTFDATYESFQLFLNDIERSLGLINVTSLSFAPVTLTTDTKKSKVVPLPTYQFTMEIESYSLQ